MTERSYTHVEILFVICLICATAITAFMAGQHHQATPMKAYCDSMNGTYDAVGFSDDRSTLIVDCTTQRYTMNGTMLPPSPGTAVP